jgi:hypothetical protein
MLPSIVYAGNCLRLGSPAFNAIHREIARGRDRTRHQFRIIQLAVRKTAQKAASSDLPQKDLNDTRRGGGGGGGG